VRARCRVPSCSRGIPDGYLFCPRHWRALPAEVRKAWSITWRQYRARPNREGAAATMENLNEVIRIAQAIAAGVLA